jgi:hypothetical protein
MDDTAMDQLELILNGAKEHEGELSDWERGFIQDTAERLEKYGDRVRVSDKQWAVLNRIWEKLPL